MVMLMKAASRTGQNNYAKLVEAVLGHKVAIFMNILFIEYTFGAMSIFLIVISKALPDMYTFLNLMDEE